MSAYECPGCGYTYDENSGAPREGFPAGTGWDAIPEDWACPDCAVIEKHDFQQMGSTQMGLTQMGLTR
jgi:rubredoxin